MISNGTVVSCSINSLRFAIERGVGQVLQQPVGFAIQNPVALLDDGMSDSLCAVTFAAARWTEEQGIFALSDPVRQWPGRRPDCGSSLD